MLMQEGNPMNATARRDIVVIGGSAGSGAVLKTLMQSLPADLPASLFIATHIPASGPGFLNEILSSRSALPVTQAVDGQPVERGHVYLAAPDRHLLVIDGIIRLGLGPRENMVRPAIDPLFRSAALSFGPRVIGVILTGMLNDGAAGLHAVKACGGLAVVQNPVDAHAEQMPLAALQATEVDHVVAAAGLSDLLVELVNSEAGPRLQPAEDLKLEVAIAAGSRLGSATLLGIASPSPLSCPDCHGVLSEVRGGVPLRYRCQIGHAYTAETLVAHGDAVDEAIRVAMRMMEERVTLVERMAQDARESGRIAVAELYEARGAEYRRYATTLRDAAVASLRLGRAPHEQDVPDDR